MNERNAKRIASLVAYWCNVLAREGRERGEALHPYAAQYIFEATAQRLRGIDPTAPDVPECIRRSQNAPCEEYGRRLGIIAAHYADVWGCDPVRVAEIIEENV